MPVQLTDEQRTIAAYLGLYGKVGEVQVFSAFVAALRDARKATGRDQVTGASIVAGEHGCWLGAIGYMALLDQIGKCFRPARKPGLEGISSIERALAYFTHLKPAEREALYALRCSFAHEFALVNCNAKKPGLNHHFVVTAAPTGNLVTFPDTPWNGKIDDASFINVTEVNLWLFGDLVERICNDLRNRAAVGTLEIQLSDGVKGLEKRYTIGVWPRIQVSSPQP
jgi:hypothetical protein